MNSDGRDRFKQVGSLSLLDRDGDGNSEGQSATVHVGLYLMSLLSLVRAERREEDDGLACCARSRSDLVATKMEGMSSNLYCCYDPASARVRMREGGTYS